MCRRLVALLLVLFIATSASAAILPRRRAVRFPSTTPAPQPQTVVLTPSKDTTLYQTTDGSISNGSGVHLFAGATQGRQLRRALIAFDLAPHVPPGSRITRVTLTMTVSQTIAGNQTMELHRVTSDWGEGSSATLDFRDGFGAQAVDGDATWIHTFRPDKRWTSAGGDFDATADATADAGSTSTTFTFASNPAMIAHVQSWVDQPAANFGWIVIGNESTSGTSKRLDSREGAPATLRPALTIDFTK
jgi:hypothetical protein